MNEFIKRIDIENKVIMIRNQHVLVDRDVAELYGVETRDINKAVKNNPDKFPDGYLINLNPNEKSELVENFHHLNPLKFSKALPTAFTEKGLYMLATILKSPQATRTTIAIIEAFTQLRELKRLVSEASEIDNEEKQKPFLKRVADSIADLLLDSTLDVTEEEKTMELDLAIFKLKKTVKRSKPDVPH